MTAIATFNLALAQNSMQLKMRKAKAIAAAP